MNIEKYIVKLDCTKTIKRKSLLFKNLTYSQGVFDSYRAL